MTADYPAVMRNHVEDTLDCYCAFFQGAAGNLVPSSRIEGEAQVPHERVAYGTRLAEYVLKCAKNLKGVQNAPLRILKRVYTDDVDHSDDHLAQKAKEMLDHYYDFPVNADRITYCQSKGFNSFLHAGGIITRSKMGKTISIDLYAIGIGDISFITAPFEMFASSGRFIKDHTPFAMTFVCTCTNDTIDYLADRTTFAYDTYEVNTRRMGAGTAEKVADTYVSMLKEIK